MRRRERRTPGAALRARRALLGISQQEVIEKTAGVINHKLLSRLENDHAHPNRLRLAKYRALLEALEWTPTEFEEATGVPPMTTPVTFPGEVMYDPTQRVPVYGNVAEVLMKMLAAGIPPEPHDHIRIDPRRNSRVENPNELQAFAASGDAVISETAMQKVPAGSLLIVEPGVRARERDIVLAWLPERQLAVIKEHREAAGTILRSHSLDGPVFRLGDEPIEVYGVARMVQQIL